MRGGRGRFLRSRRLILADRHNRHEALVGRLLALRFALGASRCLFGLPLLVQFAQMLNIDRDGRAGGPSGQRRDCALRRQQALCRVGVLRNLFETADSLARDAEVLQLNVLGIVRRIDCEGLGFDLPFVFVADLGILRNEACGKRGLFAMDDRRFAVRSLILPLAARAILGRAAADAQRGLHQNRDAGSVAVRTVVVLCKAGEQEQNERQQRYERNQHDEDVDDDDRGTR